jgi:hypothetical protein
MDLQTIGLSLLPPHPKWETDGHKFQYSDASLLNIITHHSTSVSGKKYILAHLQDSYNREQHPQV